LLIPIAAIILVFLLCPRTAAFGARWIVFRDAIVACRNRFMAAENDALHPQRIAAVKPHCDQSRSRYVDTPQRGSYGAGSARIRPASSVRVGQNESPTSSMSWSNRSRCTAPLFGGCDLTKPSMASPPNNMPGSRIFSRMIHHRWRLIALVNGRAGARDRSLPPEHRRVSWLRQDPPRRALSMSCIITPMAGQCIFHHGRFVSRQNRLVKAPSVSTIVSKVRSSCSNGWKRSLQCRGRQGPCINASCSGSISNTAARRLSRCC
jgi:hypothetical protein